jgi:hypothetical protein
VGLGRGRTEARHVETCLSKRYGSRLIAANRAGSVTGPTNTEIVNDTAKLIMHRLIARSLAHDPTLISRAKVALADAALRFPNRRFIGEWEDILARSPSEVRALLTRRDQNMKRLRLSSPFVTAEGIDFTNRDLRQRIRRAAKRIASKTAA